MFELRAAKEYWRGDERILGEGSFVEDVLRTSQEVYDRKEKLKRDGWDINKLVEYVCRHVGIYKEDLAKKSRDNGISRAKGLIAYWGQKDLGISGKEIAKELGCSRPAISYLYGIGKEESGDKGLF